jgi:hypothetical protein
MPGMWDSSPDFLAAIPGGGLFFAADDGLHGREPWAATLP